MDLWRESMPENDLQAAWQELAEQAAQQAAQNKPWLLKLLANQGAALAARYAVWKGRLGRLRQGERRRLQRQLGVGLAGAALLLALNGAPTAHAGAPIVADGATCTLIDAITAANTDSAVGGCTTGYAGADTIDLQDDVTLTAANNSTYGPTGLPVITSEITIEGNGNTIARSGTTETFRILAVGSGDDLTLNSATVSGGAATVGGSFAFYLFGGGILAHSATVVISNSTLSGNSAVVGGGIAAYDAADVSVSSSTLSGNSASSSGGGIAAWSASLAVTNSTLSGNSASTGGGILAWYSATVSVSNSTLSGNSAGFSGGGIRARSAALAVTNSTLSGNSATTWGGGIYTDSGSVTVTNSTLSGNSAGGYAGGIWSNSATVAVSNSTLSGNSAGDEGGGIWAISSTVTVANSTLSGNSAGDEGGGIFSLYGPVTLQRSLVSGNTAATSANEVFNFQGTVTAANNNLFGHSIETEVQAFYNFAPGASDITATSNNTSPATHTPTALAAILTTPLADNDSSVLAGAPPGAVVQTLALPAGSPAIDAAPSADCLAAPTNGLDQRAKARNADGDGAASSNECDIGAFELQTEVVPRIIVHKQTRPDGDTTPFEFRLRGPVGRDFSLTDNQPHSTGQIPAGIYTLEEVLPPGWDLAIPLSALTCDDGSPLSAVNLAADEVLVCRFLNYKRGNIVVKKVTLPPVAAPSFAMRLINNTTNAKTLFSLANAQQFDTGAITSVPTYKLLETVPGGWKKKNIVCDNGSPSTAIAVPPGGTVTCTVTNENTAPSNISISNSSVAENKAIGTLVGNLSATDSVAGDTHSFSFVNDGTPAAANNGNFQIVGNQLKTAKKFDFEAKSSHNIKLMVTDSAGQTRVKAFVIGIVDGPN